MVVVDKCCESFKIWQLEETLKQKTQFSYVFFSTSQTNGLILALLLLKTFSTPLVLGMKHIFATALLARFC